MTLIIIVAIAITALVLGVGAVMSDVGPWYRNLKKPSWNPPDWIFGPAWTLILGLAGHRLDFVRHFSKRLLQFRFLAHRYGFPMSLGMRCLGAGIGIASGAMRGVHAQQN